MGSRAIGRLTILAVVTAFLLSGVDAAMLWAEAGGPQEGMDKIMVKSFRFTGNTVIESETLGKVTEAFRNRDLALDEINAAADMITLAYQERGYVLARAYVPKQEVKDGVVEIVVAEGILGKIRAVGNKHYHERVLKRYFKAQEEHGIIKEGLLERALMLTNELPALDIRTVLKRGEKPGTTDMELYTEDRAPVKLRTDYNNFGSSRISRHRYGTSIEITDPDWGYTVALRGITGKKDDSMLGRAALTVPANDYGTKVHFSYMKSNYGVGKELAELSLEGDTEIYGGNVSHPLVKERNRNLEVALGYDHKYSINYILEQERSIDKLSVFYAALDFDNLDRFLGKNIVSLGLYQGVENFYSIGKDNPETSRATGGVGGADGSFTKLSLNAARIQNIYGYTNLMVRFSGQACDERLLPIEQAVIGGYGTVRGHDPSLYLGDTGYVVSSELMFGPPFISSKNLLGQRIGQLLQFALFFDHGGVYTTDPDPGSAKNEYLTGVGGGARIFYKDILTFKFDVAFPMVNEEMDNDHELYYFMGSINFF